MLIRRDGLQAQSHPPTRNIQALLARHAPPMAGYALNPHQHREAMQMKDAEKRRKELLARATGEGGEAVRAVAKKWLSV